MNNQPQGIGGVPARLRMAREQRKLNQSELCVKAGLSRKVCFKIESGLIESNHGISLGTIDRLARALGVRSAWLAFGDGGPTSAQPGATPTGPARPGPGTRPPPPPDPGGATDRRARAPLNEVEEILFWRPGKPVPAGMRKMQEEDQRLMARLDRLRPEADPEDDFEPEMSRPHAHRQFTQGDYPELPVLDEGYDPLLRALGPSMPREARRSVTFLLFRVLHGRPGALPDLRQRLSNAVPADAHPVLEKVLAQLGEPDPVRRGTMALQLIIDGGLPISCLELETMTYSGELPRSLDGPLDAALEVLLGRIGDDALEYWSRAVLAGEDPRAFTDSEEEAST